MSEIDNPLEDWAWVVKCRFPYDRLVLLAAVRVAQHPDELLHEVDAIVELTGLGEPSVLDAIRRFDEAGILAEYARRKRGCS